MKLRCISSVSKDTFHRTSFTCFATAFVVGNDECSKKPYCKTVTHFFIRSKVSVDSTKKNIRVFTFRFLRKQKISKFRVFGMCTLSLSHTHSLSLSTSLLFHMSILLYLFYCIILNQLIN